MVINSFRCGISVMAEGDVLHGVPAAQAESKKIVVVGPCAAGKSTLVSALRGLGYDAHVSGQEHSEIATLWQHSKPDVLIALDADITAVRDRRGGSWPEWLHNLQVRRLAAAARAADLAIDTTKLSTQAVVALVVAYLEQLDRN
jgi:ABC-type cobalamin/Fe3+-siderophores transport system ATPase subunit